jgi:drug/metabolite transporter (DMT)-like permease
MVSAAARYSAISTPRSVARLVLEQWMQAATSTYLKGALFGISAVAIWAGWSAITRLSVTTTVDAWDITALRFGVAALLLLPVAVRRGVARKRLGWMGLAVLVAGGGAPYVMLAASGLQFAPARDQAALNPGLAPLFVALIAVVWLREKLALARKFGLALILAGALVIVCGQGADWTGLRMLGQALFLAASVLWACFTVTMRQARIEPLHAAALVSIGSSVLYLPLYLTLRGMRVAHLPIQELGLHILFQGILVTIVSLLLYGRAIAVLGASGGAAFGALVPALAALLAIPLLGEWPTTLDWSAIALVSCGVYLASGGPVLPPESK